MDSLRISLANVPDSGFRVDTVATMEALRPEGAADLPLTDARIQGTLLPLDGEYLFRGRVVGVFHRPCDRCLRDVEQALELSVDWFYEAGEPGAAELDEGEKFVFSRGELDLAPAVWEELVLALPAKCVCEDTEGCVPAETFAPPAEGGEGAEDTGAPMHSGFAQLRELFPDLARDKSKE